MLNDIRKASNSWWFKIILVSIVITFCWNIGDLFKYDSNDDLVTFKTAAAINNIELVNAKHNEIARIQRATGTILSKEQIHEYNIDNMVLQRLINIRMFNRLIYNFDLTFSNNLVLEKIKTLNNFKNEQNIFDIRLFNNFLNNNNFSEDKYIELIKTELSGQILLNSFASNATAPRSLVEQIIEYINEVRDVEISIIEPASLSISNKFTDIELHEFYQANLAKYTEPLTKDISYIIINKQNYDIANIDEHEIIQFAQDNHDYKLPKTSDKNYKTAKDKIIQAIKTYKIDQQYNELIKNLESDVDTGDSLTELSDKFKLSINKTTVNHQNFSKQINRSMATGDIAKIFELRENEMSEIVQVTDKHGKTGCIIIQINKITPDQLQNFVDVKAKIAKDYLLNQQITLAHTILNNIKNSSLSIAEAQKKYRTSFKYLNDIKIMKSDVISRSNNKTNLPDELRAQIFTNSNHTYTDIVSEDRKIYIAKINNISLDKHNPKIDLKNLTTKINSKYNECLFDEIIIHMRNIENVKYNKSL